MMREPASARLSVMNACEAAPLVPPCSALDTYRSPLEVSPRLDTPPFCRLFLRSSPEQTRPSRWNCNPLHGRRQQLASHLPLTGLRRSRASAIAAVVKNGAGAGADVTDLASIPTRTCRASTFRREAVVLPAYPCWCSVHRRQFFDQSKDSRRTAPAPAPAPTASEGSMKKRTSA